MTVAIIIYGPKACGKTRNAEAIAKHFNCTCIVDDNGSKTTMLSQNPWPAQRTLFLINTDPSRLIERLARNAKQAGRKGDTYEAYSYDEVCKMATAEMRKREIIIVYGAPHSQRMMDAQASALMHLYNADVVYNCGDTLTSFVGHAKNIFKELEDGAQKIVVLTTASKNLEFGLQAQAVEERKELKDLTITKVFLGDALLAMTYDLSKLEDRILGNMPPEQLAAMASNKPLDFYHPGVITTEKAEAIVKQFRENHPQIAQLWPTPRKAVLPRTTGHKMPARHARDRDMPMIATAFTRDDEQSTLRIENGICTEVEMNIDKPFTLRLVALLISHFDVTPADIANETRLCGFDKEPGEA